MVHNKEPLLIIIIMFLKRVQEMDPLGIIEIAGEPVIEH